MNKVILLGKLGKEPEMRTLASGTAVVRFSLAVNRRYAGKDGEKREETTWIDVDAFGKQAETIAKYCTKGSGLLVEGRLRLDQWEDKNTGEKRSKLGVVLENFQFVGGRSREDGGDAGVPAPADWGSPQPAAPAAARKPYAPAAEEKLPF